jgi:hypothetical protein
MQTPGREWPLRCLSGRLNVQVGSSMNGGRWPRLCQNVRPCCSAEKSTHQIALYRLRGTSGRVK